MSIYQFSGRIHLFVALIAAMLAAPASALVIDSFDTSQFVSRTGIGTASGTADLTTGDLLGGERDVAVTVTTGSGTLRADADFSLDGGFSHMAAALVRGRTLVTYDGDDNDASALTPNGLGTLDLTNGGQDGLLYVVVPFSDHGAGIVITIYSGATSCSSLTRTVPPGLSPADFPLTLLFPYSQFTLGSGCSGTANFASVGAITLLIDGTSLGAIDSTISTFATGNADLGDLPPAYDNTLLADNGASHAICPGIKLGALIDAEANGQESAAANGDDNGNTDDEDGVVQTPLFVWSVGTPPGNGGRLDITVMGDGCLSGWIDWTADSSFDDAGEVVLNNVSVSAGTVTHNITVPNGVALPGNYYARFRLYDRDEANNCTTPKLPTGQVECGEVEDYLLNIQIPTPTPTVTPTLTPTRTPTSTPTNTPACGNGAQEVGEECDDSNLTSGDGCDSNCRVTGCGNGVITEGEECDDGNLENLDGCEDDCTPSRCTITGGQLIPGYCSTRKNDCLAEFCSMTRPITTDRFGALPGSDVECTDDDPTCDFGPPGDHACTFRVSLCYNMNDDRFPCSKADEIGFVRFRRANPANPLDVANRDSLEAAAIGLGGVLKVGPGVPGRRAVFFEPPLGEEDVCSEFANFKVTLRGSAPNFKSRRKLLVTVAEPPITVSHGKRDSDVLRLICNPQ